MAHLILLHLSHSLLFPSSLCPFKRESKTYSGNVRCYSTMSHLRLLEATVTTCSSQSPGFCFCFFCFPVFSFWKLQLKVKICPDCRPKGTQLGSGDARFEPRAEVPVIRLCWGARANGDEICKSGQITRSPGTLKLHMRATSKTHLPKHYRGSGWIQSGRNLSGQFSGSAQIQTEAFWVSREQKG